MRIGTRAVAAALALLVGGAAVSPAQAASTPRTSTTSPSPSASASPGTPSPAPSPQPPVPKALAAIPDNSWCRTVLPQPRGSASRAARILAGRVDLGMYGWFPIAKDPTWRPVSTLDASGNTHMHGLHWAIPLLYHGTATNNRAMVDRFYAILASWLRAHPASRGWSSTRDQHIVAGERLWTLTCAAESAAATGQDPAFWAAAARAEAARQLGRFRIVPGTNNVVIYSQSAALAASCLARDAASARRAIGNLAGLANYLTLGDGSDLEGSPHYAWHTYQLLLKSNTIANKCAIPHPNLDAALARADEFLAFATRPDGVLETLGDSPNSRMIVAQLPPGGPAAFASTLGETGKPPKARYRTYAGGYAFGRSWWRPSKKLRAQGFGPADATFYSVRTGKGPAPTAHSHSDIGSVTIMARGVRWIADPGPWRYDRSTLRRDIRMRAAHSALTVQPLPPLASPSPTPTRTPGATGTATPTPSTSTGASASPRPSTSTSATPSPKPSWRAPLPRPNSRVTVSRTSKTSDVTCIEDLTYPTTAITRCVTFQRDTGIITVKDTMKARERSLIRGRWQVPPGVRVARTDGIVKLRSGSHRAELSLAGTPAGTITTSSAWFTVAYGKKARGTTITRTLELDKGQSATWVARFTVTK